MLPTYRGMLGVEHDGKILHIFIRRFNMILTTLDMGFKGSKESQISLKYMHKLLKKMVDVNEDGPDLAWQFLPSGLIRSPTFQRLIFQVD